MKKKSKKKDPKAAAATQKPEAAVTQDREKSFDYGGLPERDLKKNLGCG